MPPEIQPVHLANTIVRLRPLESKDFETLYSVASDPLIWEQHPNPDRYKRDVFMNYFEGAVASGGALIIQDAMDNGVIGCTRFYDHSYDEREIKIGYTFFSRKCWGRGYNLATKTLMLDHAFTFVDKVVFHVGANNMRSRFAMAKLGAQYAGDDVITYYGEQPRLNCVFVISEVEWKVNKESVYHTFLKQKQSTSS
jgi:RimJ/RimL family protein N-acetyltransferase